MCRAVGTKKGQYTHSLPHTARPTGVQVSSMTKPTHTKQEGVLNPGILSVAVKL